MSWPGCCEKPEVQFGEKKTSQDCKAEQRKKNEVVFGFLKEEEMG